MLRALDHDTGRRVPEEVPVVEGLEAEVPEAMVVRPVEDRVERVALGVDAGEEAITDQPELRAAANRVRERGDALLREPLVDRIPVKDASEAGRTTR